MRIFAFILMIISLLGCRTVVLKKGKPETYSSQIITEKEWRKSYGMYLKSVVPLEYEDCEDKSVFVFFNNQGEYIFFISPNYQEQKSYAYEQQDTVFIDADSYFVITIPKYKYFETKISTETHYNLRYKKKHRLVFDWVTYKNNEHYAIFIVDENYKEYRFLQYKEQIKHVILVFCDSMEIVPVDEIDEL